MPPIFFGFGAEKLTLARSKSLLFAAQGLIYRSLSFFFHLVRWLSNPLRRERTPARLGYSSKEKGWGRDRALRYPSRHEKEVPLKPF